MKSPTRPGKIAWEIAIGSFFILILALAIFALIKNPFSDKYFNSNVAAAFVSEMGVGSFGTEVTQLQNLLIADHYLAIPGPTGYFGPLTQIAVKNYQISNGILSTGFVGPITLSALNIANADFIATLTVELDQLEAELAALLAGGGNGFTTSSGSSGSSGGEISGSGGGGGGGDTGGDSAPQTNYTIVGFATMNGGTTGGNSNVVCHAKDVPTLTACLETPQSSTVVFDVPSITFSSSDAPILVNSNKTIKGPVTLNSPNDIFDIFGQHNIIIQHISFVNIYGDETDSKLAGNHVCPDPDDPTFSDQNLLNGCGNPIAIEGSNPSNTSYEEAPSNSHNIWINQNTFTRCGNKCVVISNGTIKDSSGRFYGATDISISNNVFQKSYYGIDVTLTSATGARATSTISNLPQCLAAASAFPTQQVTVYDNLFNDVRRRSARAAYCTTDLHEFNNVIENWGEPGSCREGSVGFGPSTAQGAQLLLQNNYLSAQPASGSCTTAVNTKDSWSGLVSEMGDIFANGAQGASTVSSVFSPPYSYTPLPASQVFSWVSANAGFMKNLSS